MILEYTVKEEIPDLPADVVEVVEKFSGAINVNVFYNYDTHPYCCMKINFHHKIAHNGNEMHNALCELPDYLNMNTGHHSYFESDYGSVDKYVNAWFQEMWARYPNLDLGSSEESEDEDFCEDEEDLDFEEDEE